MSRIVIAGVPRAGKTTLALSGDYPGRVLHTDDLIRPHAWSEVSAEAAEWFDEPGPWVIEGVAAVRALRKWLSWHPTGRPCDRVLWLGTPRHELGKGQSALAKGCWTVWDGIRNEVRARGVLVELVGPPKTPDGFT